MDGLSGGGAALSDRVGHSVNWGPVTTHHAREKMIIRPFLSVRSWMIVTAALLVLAAVLAITSGSSAGGPVFVAAVVSACIVSRSAHKWREYNNAVAANKAKAKRAEEDEQDRALYRKWLREQAGKDTE